MEISFETDEFNEAVSVLELATEYSLKVSNDVYNWKWVVLFLHSALQNFMILALRDSAGLNILKNKVARKWLEAYEENKPFPREILDTFPNLYNKIKSDSMVRYDSSRPFLPTGDQDESVIQLNWFRNQFTHFIPRLWLVEVDGLPKICIECLDIIQFLGWDSGNVFWNNSEIEDRAKIAITEILENMNSVQEKYDGIKQ